MSGLDWLSQRSDAITAVASIVTAFGVLLAAWQIKLAQKQAVTQFEDNMAREYREIAVRLPIKALFGEELDDCEYREALDDFFHYVDLTNEQVFLRQNGRIRPETWANWCDGIQSNLSRPAFKKAWEEIKIRAKDSFEELRRLEESGFREDPHSWKQ